MPKAPDVTPVFGLARFEWFQALNTFTVIVNDSIVCAFTNKLVQNFDTNTPPTLPGDWTVQTTGAQAPWINQSTTNDTASNAAFDPKRRNIVTSLSPASSALRRVVEPR